LLRSAFGSSELRNGNGQADAWKARQLALSSMPAVNGACLLAFTA